MAPRFPLHAVSWVIYLIAFIGLFYAMRRERLHSLLYLAIWVGHSVLFYTVLIVSNLFIPTSGEFFAWWANALAMHGGIAVFSTLWSVRWIIKLQ